MKILHYFLGFPPYRTGGLTKYAYDLMESQVADGHYVMAIWPGQIKRYSAEPEIKKRRSIEGIQNYEIINPLPVSLDEGINEFEAFTKSCDIKIYIAFFKKVCPDIIHIHTLMGMHKEFIEAANQLNIRTVLTSHDYFGFCPKITLYRCGKCCDNDNGCRNCIQCNLAPLSLKKIKLMQSPLYRRSKDLYIVKKMRRRHRQKFFEEDILFTNIDKDIEEKARKYRELRAYYVKMYESIDFIHFNSTLAEEIYTRYMLPKKSMVISITHQGIKQHKRVKKYTGKKVILCLAPAKPYKGWNVLKKACDQLWKEQHNIELRVYSPVTDMAPYMVVKEDGFQYDELPKIMSEADVLVAPSIWYETFGFTVEEALSYGVPVIVSDHVGAKDIIGKSGVIVQSGSVDALREAIRSLDVHDEVKIKDWKNFLADNYKMYLDQL